MKNPTDINLCKPHKNCFFMRSTSGCVYSSFTERFSVLATLTNAFQKCFEEGAYPTNSHIMYCDIKLTFNIQCPSHSHKCISTNALKKGLTPRIHTLCADIKLMFTIQCPSHSHKCISTMLSNKGLHPKFACFVL